MSADPGRAAAGHPVERQLPGDRVLLVRWEPGSDTLLGVCHCGAEHLAQSPVDIWEWLLGHPAGHDLGLVTG